MRSFQRENNLTPVENNNFTIRFLFFKQSIEVGFLKRVSNKNHLSKSEYYSVGRQVATLKL